MIPARHLPSPEARRRFGDRVDRLGALLLEADPLADEARAALSTLDPRHREHLLASAHLGARKEAPGPVRELFDQVSRVPFWVDFERVERGGKALLGRGPLSGYVLALGSLVRSYCSPSGNKPLVFSGRLEAFAARRAWETARFVQQVCLPGGMRPGGAGFLSAVRVRLMHAGIRASLLPDPRWRTDLHGVPINQADMAATVLLFSWYLSEGLRRLGSPLGPEETGDLLHLWRYAGFILGVREELLCASVREAKDLSALIELTQGMPDDDSRRLARALVERFFGTMDTVFGKLGLGTAPFYALSALLLGEELAMQLGFPGTAWRRLTPMVPSLLRPTSGVLFGMPIVSRLSRGLGVAYWEKAIHTGLGGGEALSDPDRDRAIA